ncbi:MAG: FGGY family carbohydrate kinase, partial [Spirochaetota bacterium]
MILVFDIGTSLLKGGVFERTGEQVLRAEAPIHLIENQDPLYHEVDPAEWISALAAASRRLGLEQYRHIDAVVVSGNGPTLVPAGKDGKPLANAMTWMDRRCLKEAEKITELSGSYIDPTFYLPKVYWIFLHKPEVYDKTEHFFSCPEYIDYLLTGTACTILPAQQFTKYIWTDDLIRKLSMDPGKFPPFIKPGTLIGRVTENAEKRLGIPAGIPVFAGGPDFIMSLLGTATVHPGRACDRSGTSEGINLCTEHPIEDKRLLCLGHIIEGYHNISGIISTSGKALEWFKLITGREKTGYDALFEDIRQVPAGSDRLIFLPYLTGERAPIWDPLARGSFIGLTLNHGRREMTRAVVESVGYAIRDIIEVMEEIGCKVHDLRITGSQSKSPLWNQIK